MLSALPDGSFQLDLSLWDDIDPSCDGAYFDFGALEIAPSTPEATCYHGGPACP
jgi:hypothetical protein